MRKMFWHDLDFNFIDFEEETHEFLLKLGIADSNTEWKPLDFEGFANNILGSTLYSKAFIPTLKIVGYNLATFEIAITSDNPDDEGMALWYSFPFDFISIFRFENPLLQNLTDNVIKQMKINWEIGAICGVPEAAYALAVCELWKTDNQDYNKALEYCFNAAALVYDSAQKSLLCFCLSAIDHNFAVDITILNKGVEYAKRLYSEDDPFSGYYLGFFYFYEQDYAAAMKYFNIAITSDYIPLLLKRSIAEIIAPFYKDGLRDKEGNTIVRRNIHTAKKYHEMANHNGEYDADLEYINRQLGIDSGKNLMKELANRVLSLQPQLSAKEIYNYVLKDLESEFGECWEKLPTSSRQDLVSGCQVYIMLYSLGQEICKEIDFSSAIIPIVKSCEIVFRRYISNVYYDYLINNGIEPTKLSPKHPFVEYDKFSQKIVYKHKDKIEFTMGSIKWVIDLQNGINGLKTISPYFLDYACLIFGTEDNNYMMRNQVENYFVRLATQMNQLTFNIRNPAAHSDIMPIWQAEICGNEIIKVRKVLKDFMDHLKFV